MPSKQNTGGPSQKLPRNCSQPAMIKNGRGSIPKNGSVPNFERKLSKIDIVSQMKVGLK